MSSKIDNFYRDLFPIIGDQKYFKPEKEAKKIIAKYFEDIRKEAEESAIIAENKKHTKEAKFKSWE